MQNIEDRIEENFKKIANIGRDTSTKGYNRPAYSDEETKAIEVIGDDARQLGFKTEYDAIGNFYVFLNGNTDDRLILIGSHLDTVPNGGNYDGVAGVLAGLEVLRLVSRYGPRKNIKLVVWRGEESARYKQAYLGSSAAFGLLDPTLLKRKDNKGVTLEEAVISCGFDPQVIRNRQSTLNPEKIISYYELHIEQARVLESTQTDIGIVTSIRGNERYKIEINGRYDHSGGTPMNERSDTVLAYSKIVVQLTKKAVGYLNKGKDITFTAQPPRYKENEVSINKICGYVDFDIDIRSSDYEVLKEFLFDAKNIIASVSEECRVRIELEHLSSAEPVITNKNLQKKLEEGCKGLGLKYLYMPSGAGHDAAVVAKHSVPVGFIFIPCRNGVSHAPEEYTELRYIVNAAKLLFATINSHS